MVTWAVTLALKVVGRSLLTVRVQVARSPLMVGVPQVVLLLSGAGVTEVVMSPKVTGSAPAGMAVTTMSKT